MDKTVRRYYQLKKKQKELEQELAELRGQILSHCEEQGQSELTVGSYRVKLVAQERREYDDRKLYEALADAEAWRLVSRADPAKLAGVVKMNVISEEALQGTYTTKHITLMQVERL